MSCRSRLLAVTDGFLCLFVFFPLGIFHWRGTWGLQDVYFAPGDEAKSGWISLAFGTVGCIIMPLLQPAIFQRIPADSTKTYFIVSRLFMYVNSWFVMGYWRGVWDLVDYYLTTAWQNSVILYAFCQFVALVTCTARNNVGLPFSIALDTNQDILQPDRLFSLNSNNRALYVFDVVFCQLVVVTSNILVWRGMWNVFDDFLFPNDMLLSDVVSLVVGYLLCIQIFLLQWPAGITSTRLDDYPVWKILFEDVIMLVATWANLLLWRGGWDLCVKYVIPDPLIGGWICHWLGTIGLMSLQVFNSVALNGMEKDGSWKNGEGIFPTSYLRLFCADQCLSTSRKDEYEYIIRDATQVDDVMGATSIYEDEDDLPSLDDVLRHDTRPDVVQQVHYVNSSAPKVKANGYSLLPTSDL